MAILKYTMSLALPARRYSRCRERHCALDSRRVEAVETESLPDKHHA